MTTATGVDHSIDMALVYLILTLIIQSSLSFSEEISSESDESREVVNNTLEFEDEVIQGEPVEDWMDMIPGSAFDFYPTISTTLISQAFDNEMSSEEQLDSIKKMANTITMSMESEMVNLLAYALSNTGKEGENKTKTKRSVETPMDSAKLVSRLLKRMKTSNDDQKIAIEKMMTAQEIADKFGIDFSPDTDLLSDLATAASHQTEDLTSMLEDAYNQKNVTETLDFVPIEEQTNEPIDNSYYAYSMHKPQENDHVDSTSTTVNHIHYSEPYSYNYHYQPYETQIPSPAPHYSSPPVTQRPAFYEPPYTPAEYYPYCSMEPTTTTIVLPYEEPVELEPELVGEEFEETVTSRVVVDHDDPEVSTVNHVMSYTVSEKSHFRNPHIESLPQQMQYYFFLV